MVILKTENLQARCDTILILKNPQTLCSAEKL